MKKILKILLVLIFVVGFVATFYYLYAKSQKDPVVFSTEQAFTTNIVKKTVATGSVVPRNEIEIKPQLSGIISELYVEAGQEVKRGDVIAKIKVIPNMSSLNNAENRVNRAKISLENAKKDYNRNKPLFDQGVVSQQDFQRIENALDNAKEELSAAMDNLRIVRDGVSSKSAKTSNTLVKSTISGTVLDVPVEVGNSVIEANTFNAGTTIAFVADMNKMVFEGNVDESEVGKLKLGMDLILTLGAVENQKIEAVLEYISPKGVEDQGAIQFEIKAAIKNKEGVFIRAGYSANADIVLEKRDSVMAISEALLQFDEKKNPFVEIEKSSQVFEKKSVKIGLSDGLNVEILDGISASDKIKSKPVDNKPKEGAGPQQGQGGKGKGRKR
jgi:HlyD family secretion protein